jgi:hypothetical protein
VALPAAVSPGASESSLLHFVASCCTSPQEGEAEKACERCGGADVVQVQAQHTLRHAAQCLLRVLCLHLKRFKCTAATRTCSCLLPGCSLHMLLRRTPCSYLLRRRKRAEPSFLAFGRCHVPLP